MRLSPWAIADKITARWAIDLSPGTVIAPRRASFAGSIRFIVGPSRNLRADLIRPGKLSFQQRALAVANPAVEPLQIFTVVAERAAERAMIHQTDVAPKLGP